MTTYQHIQNVEKDNGYLCISLTNHLYFSPSSSPQYTLALLATHRNTQPTEVSLAISPKRLQSSHTKQHFSPRAYTFLYSRSPKTD
jgi:hypothetical protein